MKLSLIIPARDKTDPKLGALLRSIYTQEFPKDEMEVLVITEGTSESAKAIGIRRATGEVIGILASDNELTSRHDLTMLYKWAKASGAAYPLLYYYSNSDDILNRYFALIGGNDPLSYYMGKNDRGDYINFSGNNRGSLGDNGFFIKKSLIEKTDLDNYYHVDNAVEATSNPMTLLTVKVWHKTGGNIFRFFAKRYRYGFQHAFNPNRRWHIVDFHQPKDVMRLIWFVVASITIIHPMMTSIRGYLKLRDMAWFMHPIACLFTVFTYGVLVIHVLLRRLFQLSFAHMAVRTA